MHLRGHIDWLEDEPTRRFRLVRGLSKNSEAQAEKKDGNTEGASPNRRGNVSVIGRAG
jgi:hypothetical protein